MNFPTECDQDSPLRAILVKTTKRESEQGVYGRRWPHFAVCVDSLYVGSWHDQWDEPPPKWTLNRQSIPLYATSFSHRASVLEMCGIITRHILFQYFSLFGTVFVCTHKPPFNPVPWPRGACVRSKKDREGGTSAHTTSSSLSLQLRNSFHIRLHSRYWSTLYPTPTFSLLVMQGHI